MGINFNTNICTNSVQATNNNKIQSSKPQFKSSPDTFVRESKETFYAKRLEEIFPNNELKSIYANMCKELELEYPPKLELQLPTDGFAGGGYTFFANKIFLSLEDTLGSDTKLYAIQNGEKSLEMDNVSGLPKMTTKQIAFYISNSPQAAKNIGADKIIAEPATKEEIKKLFIQKLYHELVHAKQHQIMRQTEGIGTKNILKAWAKKNNGGKIPQATEKILLELAYRRSFWGNKDSEEKYAYDSEAGEYAQKCLNAIENYPPVDSPEYETNFIECEAFTRAKEYVENNYGKWE